MPTFDVAHITKQGIDLIIVPLHANFEFKTEQEQNAAVAELQLAARAAGLTGTVVPIWASGSGRMAFFAPPDCHLFLRSINLGFVAENINRRLNVGECS